MQHRKPSPRISVPLAPRLLSRLRRYARALGTTPESLLLESVIAFMDTYPLRAEREAPRDREQS